MNFAIRHKDTKELYAVIPVTTKKEAYAEAALWYDLDAETDPYQFEFCRLETDQGACLKWKIPTSDWKPFTKGYAEYMAAFK